jgi:Phosphatidylinositol-4-phosphate 5-Kinase
MAETLVGPNNHPSLLVKILGAYKVTSQAFPSQNEDYLDSNEEVGTLNPNYGLSAGMGISSLHQKKNVSTSRRSVWHVIVMEDLFSKRTILPGLTFDLKGKARALRRPTNTTSSGTSSTSAMHSSSSASIASAATATAESSGLSTTTNATLLGPSTSSPIPANPHGNSSLTGVLENALVQTNSFFNVASSPNDRDKKIEVVTNSKTLSNRNAANELASWLESNGLIPTVDPSERMNSKKTYKLPYSYILALSSMSNTSPTNATSNDSSLASPSLGPSTANMNASPNPSINTVLSTLTSSSTGGQATHADSSSSMVLLDGDLLTTTRGLPLPLTEEAKRLLDETLRRDCEMLTHCQIVDYSLLLGIDVETGEIVAGIIDYMHRFDLAKRIEHRVKAMSALATNIEPTVIQPEKYQERLIRAISDRYTVGIPDKFSILELQAPWLFSKPTISEIQETIDEKNV